MVSQGEDVEGVWSQARVDPELKAYVDAYLQGLSVSLDESAQLDPDQVCREFAKQWTPQGKAN